VGDFKQFRRWQYGEFILVFVDTAAGGIDNCAVQFLSFKWQDVPMRYKKNVTATFLTPLLPAVLRTIFKETGVRPMVAYETNNGGGFEFERLGRMNRLDEWRMYTQKVLDSRGNLVDSGKLGYSTNSATRPKMLADLKDAIEGRLLHIYDEDTVNEMFSFIVKPSGRAEAEENAHDDLVMALAGVWQLYQTEKPEAEQGGGVVETTEGNNMYKDPGVLYAEDIYE